jgi:hypothetical protein
MILRNIGERLLGYTALRYVRLAQLIKKVKLSLYQAMEAHRVARR